MRKLVTTFAILLVVLVAGMSALVLLVNPNDFKHYMVKQVAERSGYRLQLSGELRWHVWPRLSILTGPLTLTASGAEQPAVSADNMRLDVELLPLLSHQLRIYQVLVTQAVIQSTPPAAAQRQSSAPIAPGEDSPSYLAAGHWSLDIARVNVVNSLFVWQDPQGDTLNFRDLEFSLQQDKQRQGNYQLSGRVTQNQQTLTLNLQGELDARAYPQQLRFSVQQGNYQLQGVSLPPQGIRGEAAFTAHWSPETSSFNLNNLQLTANDSHFTGEAQGVISRDTRLNLNIHATNANFDNLFTYPTSAPNAKQTLVAQLPPRSPVVVEQKDHNFVDWLARSRLTTSLSADNAKWHGLALQQLQLEADSQLGVMNLSQLTGTIERGSFNLTGQVNFQSAQPQVSLATEIQRMPLTTALTLLQLPPILKGEFSLQGAFSGAGFSGQHILKQWQGRSTIQLQGLDIAQMNVQQMVIDAVQRTSSRIQANPELHPVVPPLSGAIELDRGKLQITQLQGKNQQVSVQARGAVNFAMQDLDITFNLLTRGWQGDPTLVRLFATQAIPLRFYGPWQNLHYSLAIDRFLRDSLKSEVQRWLKEQDDNHHKP